MNQVNSSKLNYRAEIDGLRAVAVISVILYHAQMFFFGRDWFKGGFVGVDVFFVISGYLITRIILLELANKKRIDFKNFYMRRARRLLPMLLFIITLSYFVGFFILIPSEIKELSMSAISSIFFVANFFFYDVTTSYGAESSLLKPLLHTWSLSVEEQFYLFFPIVVLVLFKRSRSFLLPILIVLLIGSFAFCTVYFSLNKELNFFSPIGRFWELLVGSIVAYFHVFKPICRNNVAQNILPSIGFLLLIVSIGFFDDSTPHPFAYTLLPVLGVALILAFSSRYEIVGKLLGSKPFIYLGLISYSAYLWHFPIFAYGRIIYKELSSYNLSVMLACTIVLSAVSFILIERPFRRSFSNAKFLTFSLSSIALLLSALLFTSFSNNFDLFWSKIAPSNLLAYVAAKSSPKAWRPTGDKTCIFRFGDSGASNDEEFLKKIKYCDAKHVQAVYIIGDSHAANVFDIFKKSDRHLYVVGLAQGGCRPYHCHHRKVWNQYEYFADKLIPNVRKKDVVVFHQSGSHLISDVEGFNDSQRSFDSGIFTIDEDNIKYIDSYLDTVSQKIEGTVLWLGPFIEYRYDPKVFRQISLSGVADNQTDYMKVHPNSLKVFNELNRYFDDFQPDEYKYVHFDALFKINTNAVLTFKGDQCFQFRDRDHLSNCAEYHIGQNGSFKFLTN